MRSDTENAPVAPRCRSLNGSDMLRIAPPRVDSLASTLNRHERHVQPCYSRSPAASRAVGQAGCPAGRYLAASRVESPEELVRMKFRHRHPIHGAGWVAAFVVVTSVGLVGASVAMALKVAKQPATIAPRSFGAATAQCTKGRTAVSGGFATPGFDTAVGPSIGRLGLTHAGKGAIKTRG